MADTLQTIDPMVSEKKRAAVAVRWAAVRDERDRWIQPFHDLELDKALEYLENLRNICDEGGTILNERVNSNKHIKCSGPKCGISLEGLRPNGTPRWVGKMDIDDKRNPRGKDGRPHTVAHYFCSENCWNMFMRKHQGAMGNEANK